MKLLPNEANSHLWIKIRDHLESRLAIHRRKNDGELDAIATAKLRGRIAELMNLLEMDKPDPTHSAEYGNE